MPPHTYPQELKVNSFYSGLSSITKMLLDNACGGTIADKRAIEAFNILDKIAQNSQQRTSNVRKGGRIEVGMDTQMQIQMSIMNKELQSIKELIIGKPGQSYGNKGKLTCLDEHINVLDVVEEEVEKVERLESIPNQVEILDHATKVKVAQDDEREKGKGCPIKLTDPGSFVIDVTIGDSPKYGSDA
ncbi:hypothetical protein LWI28_007220 [Acer negundo]|uniref:Uncharacterized protein n=1 Tax=Acer negundo TaxID=4023 RepID=A0AAD5NGU1_ACENE|nr:hypothetical protein LWI28_007220 [Acer negundo]